MNRRATLYIICVLLNYSTFRVSQWGYGDSQSHYLLIHTICIYLHLGHGGVCESDCADSPSHRKMNRKIRICVHHRGVHVFYGGCGDNPNHKKTNYNTCMYSYLFLFLEFLADNIFFKYILIFTKSIKKNAYSHTPLTNRSKKPIL